MGDQVAEGLNKATAPIEGMPIDVLGNLIHGRPQERVTSATPGAVTPSAALKGVASSAVNIGFLLAPELGLPVRVAVNAGLGAAYDPTNRVRGATAGLLFGETLHGAGVVAKVGTEALRGKPAVATPVVPQAVTDLGTATSHHTELPPPADVMPVGKPAPSFEDFNASVDEIVGNLEPTTASGNRKTVPGSVNDKYRLDTDQALLDRAGELLRRQEEYSSGDHGAPQFVRSDVPVSVRNSDAGASVQGGNSFGFLSKPISGETSVAVRMRQDLGLYQDVKAELMARGWPESDLNDAIDQRYRNEAPPAVVAPDGPAPGMAILSQAQIDHMNTPEGQDALAQRLLATPEQRAAFREQTLGENGTVAKAVKASDAAQNGAPPAEPPTKPPAGTGGPPDEPSPQPASVDLRSHDETLKINDAVAKPITSRWGVDAMRRIFAPANRGAAATSMGDVIRSNRGEMDRTNAVAAAALEDFKKTFDKTPEPENLKFYDNMENGRPQETPQLTLAAEKLRGLNDAALKAVQDLGTGKLDDPILNYMAHIWEDPAKATGTLEGIVARRPLAGSKNFLKPRTIPTLREGIEAGLKPVSTNPVELTLRKLHEMNKYIMAQRILADAKEKGLLQFVKATDARPDGYVAINDPIATVSGPLTSEGARTIRGSYAAPEQVARVLNNYLSPGLRGDPIFKAYMAIGNAVNQATLGLSAYHAGFTTMEAMISKFALGIEQVSSGRYAKAAETFYDVPGAAISNFKLGGQALKEYNAPGSVGGQMSTIMDALAKAGGRAKMSQVYKNNAIERMTAAIAEKRPIGAVANAIPAALELAAKPVMEYLVPRQKLGIFADLMSHRLDEIGPNATPDQITREAAQVWESVDNRMGQVVYDNYFWNAAFKDLSMASVRSVGWNAGTLRELGGGMADLATSRSRMARGEAFMTHKLAYTISLPIMAGMMGAITTYLYTGKGPDTLEDYYHPKTGRQNDNGDDERVNLPSYMKDVFAYKRHPWQTVQNKLHPMIGVIADMLNNKDYFGDMIRNPDDPLVVQLQQEAMFVAKSVEPYGISNMMQQKQRGQSATTQALSFVGITPASREDTRSPAENLMAGYIAQSTPGDATPEQKATYGIRRDIRGLARAGQTATPDIINAVKSGAISRQSVETTARNAMLPPSVVSFKKLQYDQAVKVYNLGEPDEQRLWYPILVQKYGNYAAQH